MQNLQLKGLEKDSIKFMSRAHNLHTLTAYTDLDRLATALRNNSISGTPKNGAVTARDVENYKKHMHASVCNGCRFGKSSSAPAAQLDNVDTCHDIGTLYADIFHINLENDWLNFFIAIDGASKMTFVIQIRDLNSANILNSIYEIKNIFTSYQHVLTNIHVDNARGIDNAHMRESLYRAKTTSISPTVNMFMLRTKPGSIKHSHPVALLQTAKNPLATFKHFEVLLGSSIEVHKL